MSQRERLRPPLGPEWSDSEYRWLDLEHVNDQMLTLIPQLDNRFHPDKVDLSLYSPEEIQLFWLITNTSLEQGLTVYNQLDSDLKEWLLNEMVKQSNPALGKLATQILSDRSRPERYWMKQWLARYGDHPGAGDAGYWLGQTLAQQGKYIEAMQVYADLFVDLPEDSLILGAVRHHFLLWLDLQAESQDFETFLRTYPDHLLASLVQYSLAVRYARQHRYQKALELTEELLLPKMIERYPQAFPRTHRSFEFGLADQRQRWSKLSRCQAQDTPEAKYRLAESWSDTEGWKNGYLLLYQGYRVPTLRYALSPFDPEIFPPEAVKQANNHFVALELLVDLLQEESTPEHWIEKSRHLQILALTRQFILHPIAETRALYLSIPHLLGEEPPAWPDCESSESSWDCYSRRALVINGGYVDQVTTATNHLLTQFPHSKYGPDALLSLFEMTGDACVAKRFSVLYPNQDHQLSEIYERVRRAEFQHSTQPRCGGIGTQILWKLPSVFR